MFELLRTLYTCEIFTSFIILYFLRYESDGLSEKPYIGDKNDDLWELPASFGYFASYLHQGVHCLETVNY